MSIFGITKGTDLEKNIGLFMKGEANGAMIYQALARLAREQGYTDAAEAFEKIAFQESVHAGFYAVLNGKYPQDFWQLVAGIQKAEAAADKQMQPLIDLFRTKGQNEVANELTVFMEQENQHGIILTDLLRKHAPQCLGKSSDDIMASLMD